jgi:hypothetical protein
LHPSPSAILTAGELTRPRDDVDALWAAAGFGAIADITDGPPLGSCSARLIDRLRAP